VSCKRDLYLCASPARLSLRRLGRARSLPSHSQDLSTTRQRACKSRFKLLQIQSSAYGSTCSCLLVSGAQLVEFHWRAEIVSAEFRLDESLPFAARELHAASHQNTVQLRVFSRRLQRGSDIHSSKSKSTSAALGAGQWLSQAHSCLFLDAILIRDTAYWWGVWQSAS
jgi:hypothetical protein